MAGSTAIVVVDVQLGMLDTPGAPPVPGERLILAGRRASVLGYDVVTPVKDGYDAHDDEDLSAARNIARHNEVLGDWFATADEVRFGEPATR